MRTGWLIGVAAMAGGLLVAVPALADVKSGVDAWTRGDYKRAVDEWRAPALAGDADAQFNLGQAYKLGRGVPLDPALARSWFLKAANQGHLQAADNYGLALFENGQKAEAAPWLEKSVARFEPRAQLVLGTMMFNGDGVPRDYPRAYALMTRASAQGMKAASETMAQMDQYITPADRQKGVELAQRYAAEQNAMKLAQTGAPLAGDGLTPLPPPSRPATMRPMPVAREPAPALPAPRSQPIEPKARPTAPAVASRPTPPAVVAAGTGRWKIQLGAFRDQGNARALWSNVAGRLPGAKPIYASSGGITRLQAGPFPGKPEAQRACAAVKQTCVVVAP